MVSTRVFNVEGSSVGNGSSDELIESDNDSWVVEKIQVVEESSNLGSTSDVTISVSGNSVTDQSIPLSVLNSDYMDLPEWNFIWQANKQLEFAYTNESGGSITLDFVVYVREATETETNEAPGTIVG
jgi:hypothetical protein